MGAFALRTARVMSDCSSGACAQLWAPPAESIPAQFPPLSTPSTVSMPPTSFPPRRCDSVERNSVYATTLGLLTDRPDDPSPIIAPSLRQPRTPLRIFRQ